MPIPNRYTPKGPILAGAAKCAKKGHRPSEKRGWCTRCGVWNPDTKKETK